jgi:ABC-type multidrug transport system fused ATPase/permease subunit
MGLYQNRISSIENRVKDFYFSNKLTYPYLIVMAICILLGSGYVAYYRPLWHDELVTFYIAQLPSLTRILDAFLQGAHNNTPVDFMVRHISMQIGGFTPLWLRLPSLLMFITNGFFLYKYVSFRIPSLPASVAFWFPVFTYALHYSFEGRYYAPLLAWSAVALYFWQQSYSREYKTGYLLLLIVSLLAGSFTHLYGVFNYVPIFLGEAVRLYNAKTRIFKTMAAIILSAALNVFLYPFVVNTAAYRHHFWTPLGIGDPFQVYISLLPQIGLAVAAIIVIMAVLSMLFPKANRASANSDEPEIPVHEMVAAVAFCLFPFFMYIAAVLVTKAFDTAYCIVTVNGLTVLVVYACHIVGNRNYTVGVVLVSCLMLLGAFYMAKTANEYSKKEAGINPRIVEFIKSARLPIAISQNLNYLYYYYYLPGELKNKIAFIMDEQQGIKYLNKNISEITYRGLNKIVKLNIPRWKDFAEKNKEYYIVTKDFNDGWLIMDMSEKFRDKKIDLDLMLVTKKDKIVKVKIP